MEAAGHLVAAAAELAAGVEHGVDDLERVLAGRVLADRHAAAVVDDLDQCRPAAIVTWIVRGVAGHRLVDRVVDDLPDEVVEAADVGRADVHARAAANGLEALEDLDARGGVVGAGRALPRRRPAPFGAVARRCRRSRPWLPWSPSSRGSVTRRPPTSRW